MPSNTSTFRFALRAAGWMLSALLLCGCSFPAAIPLQPMPQTPAAQDPPEKGVIRGSKPASTAKADAPVADNAKPAGARGLLLQGGWYRIPLTAEESAAGVYDLGAGSGERGAGSGEHGAGSLAKQEKASEAAFRYRHAGLEQLMTRPASQQSELPKLLTDSDHNVAATAAIALARKGDAKAAPRLVAAVENEDLPLPARCAAAEALGQLSGASMKVGLQTLVDRHGQFAPGASTGYQADLHAELLRALARHIDAADDPRFIAATQIPSAAVRIETLRAWAAGARGSMPSEIADLRNDDDARVRAAAIKALAARQPPGVRDILTSALHDSDLAVRLAAIRGLGRLDDAQARATLAEVLKDRSELLRAEAVAAIAAGGGSRAMVLGAAGDASWRVRLKVAEALAAYGDRDGAATARHLLDDPSAEVERQVVRSLTAWSWEMAGPVLLDALSKNAITVRKLAAEQVAIRWPAGGRFPFEAPPPRRAEALGELQTRYQREFGVREVKGGTSASRQPEVAVDDVRVEKLLAAGDIKAMAEIGPPVVAALERLAIDRKLTLPEPVYRDVLPRYSGVFAELDRMHDENVDRRRHAAEELVAAAGKQPLGRLAVARLCTLLTSETDTAVWLSALDAVRQSDSEPAIRMARSALGQAAAEVRRRACEHLAAHPDPAHDVFLVPLLGDSEQAVVVAAIRGLGAAGQMRDIEALKKQFASANEEIQLETAVALIHLHERGGEEAIERLSYSSDIMTRARVAQALGALGDIRLTGTLIRLLDDPRATVSHAALAALPKAAGRDLGQSGDGATVPTAEQIARWKKWYASTAR